MSINIMVLNIMIYQQFALANTGANCTALQKQDLANLLTEQDAHAI